LEGQGQDSGKDIVSKVPTSKKYWKDYNNLQRVKHRILKRYLGAWYPILTSWEGRVLYIETHAGRGKHASGELGSPLVALNTLLSHRSKPFILADSEITYVFIENDAENVELLKQEVAALGELPEQVNVMYIHEDYEVVIDGLIEMYKTPGENLAPAILFVDPFSVKLPTDKFATLLQQSKWEVVINLMWRYVNLALHNSSQSENMDTLFGKGNWEDLPEIVDPGDRCDEAIARVAARLGADQYLSIKMLGKNNAIKYVLVHAANHPKARQVMKEVLWAVCPTGGFRVRQSENLDQEYLISPTPDLGPLQVLILQHFAGKTIHYTEVLTVVNESLYRPKHLHTILRAWRKDKTCTFTDYEGKFAFNRNPRIAFPSGS